MTSTAVPHSWHAPSAAMRLRSQTVVHSIHGCRIIRSRDHGASLSRNMCSVCARWVQDGLCPEILVSYLRLHAARGLLDLAQAQTLQQGPHLLVCVMQGGRNCTKENPARQKDGNAVPGLHSNWVGDNILATARPWQDNVIKHDLVSKFKELNIGMILNLQEVRSNHQHTTLFIVNISTTFYASAAKSQWS